jgi:hypothetical protein
LRGHEDAVGALTFSADGRYLATASDDGTARLWDLTQSNVSSVVLRGHTHRITTLALSFDGRYLATGSDDTTTRLWRVWRSDVVALACATAGRNPDWEEWQQFFGGAQYKKLCPNLPAFPNLIDTAADLAATGDITGALELRRQALADGSAAEIPAVSWNLLCLAGSRGGRPGDTLDACQQAVDQMPERGTYRASRGIARALIGDSRGAIEDLQAYLAWARQVGVSADVIEQREGWIAALLVGENPFDAITLESLLNE